MRLCWSADGKRDKSAEGGESIRETTRRTETWAHTDNYEGNQGDLTWVCLYAGDAKSGFVCSGECMDLVMCCRMDGILRVCMFLYYFIVVIEQLSFLNGCNYVINNEVSLSLHQTEIAKRLNTICAQVIPFLSQEVSMCDIELQLFFCVTFVLSRCLCQLH